MKVANAKKKLYYNLNNLCVVVCLSIHLCVLCITREQKFGMGITLDNDDCSAQYEAAYMRNFS